MARKVGMPKELGMGYDGKTAVKGDPYKAVAKSLRRKSVFAATVAAALGSTSALAMQAHGAMWAQPAYVVTPTGRLVWPEAFRQETLARVLEAGHRVGKNGISFEDEK